MLEVLGHVPAQDYEQHAIDSSMSVNIRNS